MPGNATPRRVFVLSPANLSGPRAQLLMRSNTRSELAQRLRAEGAPLGEVFSFISGLYFRGKLAYARAFSDAATPLGNSVLVITSTSGLIPPDRVTSPQHLRRMATVPIHVSSKRYIKALEQDALQLAAQLDGDTEVVLLGSVATPKYIAPLSRILGTRLVIPRAFVGLGDMARGALLLRAVRERTPLDYITFASTRASASK